MTSRVTRSLAVVLLFIVAIMVRISLLHFVTGDAMYWVMPWYEHLRDNGFAAFASELPNRTGYQDHLGGYTPPYHYLLYLATFADGLLPTLSLVKMVSLVFDVVMAGVMFALVRVRYPTGVQPWVAFFAVLFAPTVVLNGAFWAQCDSVYTAVMLGALYLWVVGRPSLAAFALGAALAIKAQPVFMLPFVLMMCLRSWLRWRDLALIPAGYLAMMLPALAAGRPLRELLLVYANQSRFFSQLSMNSPNLYWFVPNDHYAAITQAGIAATVMISVAFAWWPRHKRTPWSGSFLVLAATVSVSLAPSVLPKMLDRYFFPADIFSIALAFFTPSLWFVPIVFQVSSTLAYVPVVSDVLNNFRYEYTALMPVAAAINMLLVPFLAWVFVRRSSAGAEGAGS